MTTETMSRADRDTLVKIARQRERVAKTEAKERAAILVADFEKQMDRRYAYDENEVWNAATLAAEAAVKEAKEKIAQECERLGIPREFAPGLSLGWYGKGRNATKDERSEMRRIAARQIEAAQKSAFSAIERQSVQVQESIMISGLTSEAAREMLASMPTVDTLMPALTIDNVVSLIASDRARDE